jgi:DNA-binding HxlR family transcriptional regulator
MKVEKITTKTTAEPAEGRRWYDDACGTAHALELVGERWSLLILRELMFGPRRFNDIRASLPGLSANVLTQRLETLENHGLVIRSKLPPPASVQVYGLTDWGYEADQLLMVLGAWAARSPGHDPTLPLSKASLMLSFRTMFKADLASHLRMSVGFRLGEETFLVRIEDGTLTPIRAQVEDADLVFISTPEAMAGFVYGKIPLEAMEASGAIALQGDREKAVVFQALFNLPPKAPMRGAQTRLP